MKKRTMNEYRQTKEYYTPRNTVGLSNEEHTKEYSDDELVHLIASQLTDDLHDILFEHIIEAMNDYPEANWLDYVDDEEAPVQLLDACFEHKHDLHSRIYAEIVKNL